MTIRLTDADRDAMTRPIEMWRAEKGRRQQVDAMLTERPWARVGRFAAYCSQTTTLRLEPWEWPPLWIREIDAALHAPDDARRIGDAARLLQRMLALNISRYEPSPRKAIEQAEAKP
jgi:hypothetical protein